VIFLKEVEIVRIDLTKRESRHIKDCVAQEKPLNLFINRSFYATIFCSPSNLEELAVGHLASEGIVKSIIDIEEIEAKDDVCLVRLVSSVDAEKKLRFSRHFGRVILSACGMQGPYKPSRRLTKIKSTLKIQARMILDCVNKLNSASVFRKTGGVHAAAIFRDDGTTVAFAEDVGRHNAVDKAMGMAIMNKADLGKCFLASTGRLTGDMVMKSATVGLPIVASIAAAIDSGIIIAKKANVTLAGFVRGNRMNVYSCPERILS
jgi:FdhD protein